jgi:hypothetical protein
VLRGDANPALFIVVLYRNSNWGLARLFATQEEGSCAQCIKPQRLRVACWSRERAWAPGSWKTAEDLRRDQPTREHVVGQEHWPGVEGQAQMPSASGGGRLAREQTTLHSKVSQRLAAMDNLYQGCCSARPHSPRPSLASPFLLHPTSPTVPAAQASHDRSFSCDSVTHPFIRFFDISDSADRWDYC